MNISKLVITLIVLAVIVIIFVAAEWLLITYNGKVVPAPDVDRGAHTQGSGKPLTYVILGDSTAAGQGASEGKGIGPATAQFLAQDHAVSWYNFAVSGARAEDVATSQLEQAIRIKADIVLISVGSNDVTHLTSPRAIHTSMTTVIDGLLAANCNTRIVLTGSAAMGSVPRIPQPLRWLAGQRANQLNNGVFTQLIHDRELTFAPVAEKTGPTFLKDRSLFAADNFHPNDAGYDVWTPVLTDALKEALRLQPSHCTP